MQYILTIAALLWLVWCTIITMKIWNKLKLKDKSDILLMPYGDLYPKFPPKPRYKVPILQPFHNSQNFHPSVAYSWKEKRYQSLGSLIELYREMNFEIPQNWIDERADLGIWLRDKGKKPLVEVNIARLGVAGKGDIVIRSLLRDIPDHKFPAIKKAVEDILNQ